MSDDLLGSVERLTEQFDLSRYEIETYLTVLEHGELTATEIAERTSVPQPRVYDTVRSLGDDGLVEVQETRPIRVAALDPRLTLGEVRQSFDALIDALGERYTEPSAGAAAAKLVQSRSTVRRYLADVVRSAEYELSLSLTPALFAELESELLDASRRDVRTELVLAPAAEAPDPAEADYGRVAVEVRERRGITTPVLAVGDGEYSVYTTQDTFRTDGDQYAVIFDQSALGFLTLGFFGTVLWTTAESVFRQSPERRLPRSYASLRQCIKDLEGVEPDVYATIRGRDILTGEPRTLEGRIAETRISEDQEVATLVLDTDAGEVAVGGQVATYEDVEAHEIRVALGAPP